MTFTQGLVYGFLFGFNLAFLAVSLWPRVEKYFESEDNKAQFVGGGYKFTDDGNSSFNQGLDVNA